MKPRLLLPSLACLLLVVLAAYANHFHNDFHFDDFHSITGNLFLEELRNIPRFFSDPMLSSTLPDHAMYRPLVTASLALDYRLAHGYQPFWFHLSTFLWFLLQLVLMFFLFRHLTNPWTALAATACYGLHPANAETLNYIIQRAEVYSTLGVIASLLCFIAWPQHRKYGWYLIPALAADLSKAPALIFPFILLAYVWLFEDKRWRSTLPAFAVTAVAAIFTAKMTPATFQGGATSDALYRLTQPWVALHYCKSFFLPTQLTADTDWTYLDPFSLQAIAGYLFVIALLAAAAYTARRPKSRAISFGLFWFFLALLPTSLMPLAEVTNDHRMFFPFVGLSLAVFAALHLAFIRGLAILDSGSAPSAGSAISGFDFGLLRVFLRALRVSASSAGFVLAALLLVFAAEAAGTHARNQVWHTEESLWQDVAAKSPRNARGLMNYGITFIPRDYSAALTYLERAQALKPDYHAIQFNLGRAYAGLGRDADAELHFKRAIELSPQSAEPYTHYALWLQSRGRLSEAQAQLEAVLKIDPLYFPARKPLIAVYTQQKNWQARDRLIEESLRLSNNDDLARRYMADRATPEALLNLSAKYCKAGNYTECLAAAETAIQLRPAFAEAYNNAAAAHFALQQWDEGIQAAREAIRLKPDYQDARTNLEWALTQKR